MDDKNIVLDGHMITSQGVLIDLWNPNPDLINIIDIAHGLSNTCRWNGHTKTFWSVAQHCCMAYDKAPKKQRLTHLLHDAEEAYWGDIIKPIKNILEKEVPEITDLMDKWRSIIYEKFNVLPINTAVIDTDLLYWEYENQIKEKAITGWLPIRAKQEFLNRFYTEING